MLYVQDIKRLLRRRDGNFGITTALVLPILVGVAGLAVDTANLTLSQRQLQEATDASALAVSTALANGTADETSGKTLGLDFLSGQVAGTSGSTAAAAAKKATTVSITTTTSSSGKSFVVGVSTSMPVTLTPLSALIAGNTRTVAAASKTTSGTGTTKNGISIELLLDASTSMAEDTTTQNGTKCAIYLLGICIGTQPAYYSKIDALKIAAAKLFDSLDKFDPNARYVRSGAISYTSSIKGQSPMAWGTTSARGHVSGITIEKNNGTDATAAMKAANAKPNTMDALTAAFSSIGEAATKAMSRLTN